MRGCGSATSVVLLRAEGRSFCAGYDIGAKGPGADDWRSDQRKRMHTCSRSSNSR